MSEDDWTFNPGTSWNGTRAPVFNNSWQEQWFDVGGVKVTGSDQYFTNVLQEAQRIYGDAGIRFADRYTSEGGRNNSCDTITMCNVYDSQVISTKFASRKACNDACNNVYNELAGPNQFNGCIPTIGVGLTWCSKYCNSNYPE